MRRVLIVANATAFTASFCVMVVELTAGRILARYLGTSIYTWTSIIGVVLSGIALGNYTGGRLADRGRPAKTLSLLFLAASIGCGLVPMLNRAAGSWQLFWMFSWPARVCLHIAFVFLLPSFILGMVGPVVAKFALDQGRQPGWTIGAVYAWSALGSIAGTFLTGFVLIGSMGTAAICWMVAGLLAGLAVVYAVRSWLPYLWGATLVLVTLWGFGGGGGWAQAMGEQLGLREPHNPAVIYERDSPYFFIRVMQSPRFPRVRWLMLDQVLHSAIDLDDPANIEKRFQYPYMTIWAAITRQAAGGKKHLRALVIGGGGYVFPRYLRYAWPQGTIDAVEIDPMVTTAAMHTLGFVAEGAVRVHHLDARHYVNELVWRRHQDPEAVPPFDVIYGDALSGLSIPFQLATREFNDHIRSLLAPDGLYMISVIDLVRSGDFLGALANTFRQSFPFVYVVAAGQLRDSEFARNMFVVIGANSPLDMARLDLRASDGSVLDEARLRELEERAGELVLSDDYAPVDNLLAPVVQQDGRQQAAAKLTWIGDRLVRQGQLDAAIQRYYRALRVDPDFAGAHNNLGSALARQGSVQEAKAHFEQAIGLAKDFAEPRSNLATLLASEGKFQEARDQLEQALAIVPDYAEVHHNLATLLAGRGRLTEAAEHYWRAIAFLPSLAEARVGLANVLTTQGRLPEAIEQYQQALEGALGSSSRAKVHNNLGAIAASQGNLDEAVAQYRKALEIDPGYGQAKQGLDRLL